MEPYEGTARDELALRRSGGSSWRRVAARGEDRVTGK
jgi:hypothetical protein